MDVIGLIGVFMSANHVVIIAFREFDNLGVGYLASVLSEKGYDPLIIDFRDGKDRDPANN